MKRRQTVPRYLYRVLLLLRFGQLLFFSLGCSCAIFLIGTAGASDLGLMSLSQILIRVVLGALTLFCCVIGHRICGKQYRRLRAKRRRLSQPRVVSAAA